VSSLVFLDLSVLHLGPMYPTDRQTDTHTDRHQTERCQRDVRRRTASSLNAPAYGAGALLSPRHRESCNIAAAVTAEAVISDIITMARNGEV